MVRGFDLIKQNEWHNSGFFIGNPLSKKILSDWNIQLHNTELRLEGRNIKGPKLNFGKRQVEGQADFGREAVSGVVDPVSLFNSINQFV